MTATVQEKIGTEALKDLFLFLSEITDPVKDADNPYFKSKYAPLNSVLPEIKKVALKHNYRIMQRVTGDNGEVSVETILMHKTGDIFSSGVLSMAITPDKNGVVTPQALGSMITYMRRYQAYPFFGIAEMDDDGNAGSHKNESDMPNKSGAVKGPIKTEANKKKPEEEPNDFDNKTGKIEMYEGEIKKAKTIDDLNVIWKEIQQDGEIDEDGVNILVVAVKARKKEITKK